MTIAQQLEQETGRRRADTAEAVGRAPGAIPTAFAEFSDRNDLLEHNITTLESVVDDLIGRLATVLPDAPTAFADETAKDPGTPAQIDSRGQVARSISAQARRVDQHAAHVAEVAIRLGRIADLLEV